MTNRSRAVFALTLALSLALSLALASSALAKEPTADDIIKTYDSLMGPLAFESDNTMTATREDGTTRSYEMHMLKRDTDKFRVYFTGPASVKGQELLRIGDNAWVYLPNLKRATRIANRESFQGGDFNNADVLRVNYTADYSGTLAPSDVPDTYCVQLKAKHQETAYDAVTLYVRTSDLLPVRAKYFGTSGKLIRSAEFADVKELSHGFTRPSRIIMRNELVPARKSELVVKAMRLDVDVPPQRFTQTDLGK